MSLRGTRWPQSKIDTKERWLPRYALNIAVSLPERSRVPLRITRTQDQVVRRVNQDEYIQGWEAVIKASDRHFGSYLELLV
jgi:hypothetical protein